MTERVRTDTRLAWLIIGGSAMMTVALLTILLIWAAGQASRWAAEQARASAAERRGREAPFPVIVPPTVPDTARPIGSPARWLGPDDYPSGAQRRGEEGRVRVTLAIDRAGRPAGCSVALSSGSASLNDGTCTVLMRKGRFDAAPDGPTTRRWTSPPIRWVLPE